MIDGINKITYSFFGTNGTGKLLFRVNKTSMKRPIKEHPSGVQLLVGEEPTDSIFHSNFFKYMKDNE